MNKVGFNGNQYEKWGNLIMWVAEICKNRAYMSYIWFEWCFGIEWNKIYGEESKDFKNCKLLRGKLATQVTELDGSGKRPQGSSLCVGTLKNEFRMMREKNFEKRAFWWKMEI